MREPVLDIGLLRFVAFTLSGGLPRLLAAMAAPAVRAPAEVYNGDEDANLPEDDIGLSGLARDIRAVRRQAQARHWSESQRERAALRNAEQLRQFREDGLLIVDALRPGELPRREQLRGWYGIGRSEAASLVLAERRDTAVAYLSPEGLAYNAAQREGIRFIVLSDAVAA